MGSHPLNTPLHLHPVYLQREKFSKSPQTLKISFHLGHLQEDGAEKSYGEYYFFFFCPLFYIWFSLLFCFRPVSMLLKKYFSFNLILPYCYYDIYLGWEFSQNPLEHKNFSPLRDLLFGLGQFKVSKGTSVLRLAFMPSSWPPEASPKRGRIFNPHSLRLLLQRTKSSVWLVFCPLDTS